MSILLLGLSGPVFLAAGVAIGVRLGARRERADLSSKMKMVVTERDAAERRSREAIGETLRWRGMSLAGAGLSRDPVFLTRPAPVDANELVTLARGLMLVDDVVITDAGGMPMTVEQDAASTALCAIGGVVAGAMRTFARSALPAVQLSFETFGADHIVVRALPGRADGLFLVMKTTSQPANPLVLDAVVHAASRNAEVPSLSAPLALRGTTETKAVDEAHFAELYAELGREVRNDVRAVALTVDGKVVFAATHDGPDETTRGLVARELSRVQARVGSLLHGSGVSRVEMTLRDGSTMSWAALAPGSRLAVQAFGRLDPRSVERLAGRLRRLMDQRGQSQGRAA